VPFLYGPDGGAQDLPACNRLYLDERYQNEILYGRAELVWYQNV
jgi:hypothetical protein